jgi:hypothetical protein
MTTNEIDRIINDTTTSILARRREFGLPLPCPSFEEYEKRRAFNMQHFVVPVATEVDGVYL